MENSNTLPVIEIGDNSQIDIDFNGNVMARIEIHGSILSVTAAMDGHGNGIDLERISIKEVIKPTKERVYTEQEIRKAIEMARVGNKSFWGYTADAIIESLNK